MPENFANVDAIYALADSMGWPWKRSKTRPFAPVFTYLGFTWDIDARFVSIPPEKCTKYSLRLNAWLGRASITRKETEVLIGTLVHCSLVIPEGRPKLAALIAFAASFPSALSHQFLRKPQTDAARTEVNWWLERLSAPICGCAIRNPPDTLPTVIYTDASSSFGLGVIIDNEWAAWRLLHGWKQDGRADIGWAEVVAVELAVSWLVERGVRGASINIGCDNQGVVFAWKAGRSRNSQQNESIARIQAVCASHDIWLSLFYVESAANPADGPSRGIRPKPPYKPVSLSPPVPVPIRAFAAFAHLL